MTITRTVDGKEMVFELTFAELRCAMLECQGQYDKEDVLWFIDGMDDAEIMEEYGITRAQFESLLPRMTVRYRKCLDNDDGWSETCDWAIRNVIREAREAGELDA